MKNLNKKSILAWGLSGTLMLCTSMAGLMFISACAKDKRAEKAKAQPGKQEDTLNKGTGENPKEDQTQRYNLVSEVIQAVKDINDSSRKMTDLTKTKDAEGKEVAGIDLLVGTLSGELEYGDEEMTYIKDFDDKVDVELGKKIAAFFEARMKAEIPASGTDEEKEAGKKKLRDEFGVLIQAAGKLMTQLEVYGTKMSKTKSLKIKAEDKDSIALNEKDLVEWQGGIQRRNGLISTEVVQKIRKLVDGELKPQQAAPTPKPYNEPPQDPDKPSPDQA